MTIKNHRSDLSASDMTTLARSALSVISHPVTPHSHEFASALRNQIPAEPSGNLKGKLDPDGQKFPNLRLVASSTPCRLVALHCYRLSARKPEPLPKRE